MIDKLKFLIDECENKPKLKSILLKIASLEESKQKPMLDIIEIMINNK